MASQIMATINRSKHIKTERDVAPCLSDLPGGILEYTASFLARPSRALFAVALTIDGNNNPPGEVESGYSSIAGSDWETLDFGEIEEELAARLSDDDISDVLQHIDAVNCLKRLRLTNCIKITGVALEPLRGSTMIEQIDLSLTGDGESPVLDHEPPISCEAVLPILDSIIAAEGCSLKHLQFPYKWRKDRSAESAFHGFILRYHQMRETRDTVICLSCEEDLPEHGNNWIFTGGSQCYGTHTHACFQCTKHYCYDCNDEDGIRNFGYCDRCQRDYCKNCVKVDDCVKCGEFSCEHCSNYKECDECNGKFCSGCTETFTVCVYCGLSYCNDCDQISDGFTISLCEECNEFGCDDCRLRRCHEGSSDCDGCIESLPQDTLVAQFKIQQERVRYLENEVSELRRLQEEVEQLKSENRELKLENKVLKDKEI